MNIFFPSCVGISSQVFFTLRTSCARRADSVAPMAEWRRDEPIIDRIVGESVDPDGKPVVLLRRVWDAKVLRDHPEMEGHIDTVLQAVSAPSHSAVDPVYENRRRYYLQGAGPSQWLMVVVSYEQEPARIVSAFGNRKGPRSWKK